MERETNRTRAIDEKMKEAGFKLSRTNLGLRRFFKVYRKNALGENVYININVYSNTYKSCTISTNIFADTSITSNSSTFQKLKHDIELVDLLFNGNHK